MSMDKIYFGVDYYPEDWEEEFIDSDIQKMKECGFNVVRIGEFAWKKDEPEEGIFNFSWLHRVVDKMAAAGISVIMGTPTATPPHWLYKKYPDMAIVSPQGARTEHGGRRHCCSSNLNYKKYSSIIVEKLAQEFGSNENIIGWQIDNEIYPWGQGCCCESCIDSFHKYLKKKYGSVENINKAWNLNLFSQAYDSIDDIPVPINAWHNPHIKLEWNLSQAKNHVEFVHMQTEILKKYTTVPIGTDTMPFNAIDYRTLNEKLDVVQFNHYNLPENITVAAMWMDYLRHFSKIPFWNTETQACWNGSTAQGMSLPPEGYIYMNTWLPIMLGGGANLYWLWRTHWAGHELMHGAVLDSCGRYTYANGEIRKAIEDIKKVEKLLHMAPPEYDTALMFTSLNWNLHQSQEISRCLKDGDGDYHDFYDAILRAGIHPDVIDARQELDKYKLIFSPLAFTLEEGKFEERITKWVQEGGVWVAGPLSDIRTSIGTKYKESPYSFLEKLTGIHQVYTLPDDAGKLMCENECGEIVKCGRNYELFDAGDFKNIITIKGGNSVLIGKACVVEVTVGKGKVILLGTFPEERELKRIIKKAAVFAGVHVDDISDGMMITRREGEDVQFVIAAAIGGIECKYRFSGQRKDMLSGTMHDGSIVLRPYEVVVLSE